jgi:5-formyltetrahydrofolate cyclo-ligase
MTRMTKEEARREARARLRALPRQGSGESQEFESRIWSLPEMAGARVVLLYADLPGEVPTEGLSREAGRRGMTVTYPRCLPGGRLLALHHVAHAGDLVEGGAHGIREPVAGCPRLEVGEIEVALIPGLAWDRDGTRLGRGAGYYDRLLADPGWRAARVGLFWSAQEMESLPRDSWDVPLDVIVTEREVWRPPRR